MKDTFRSDLAIGKIGEEKVLLKIKNKYPCAVIIEGYFKGYDIWIPEIHKSVEVKYQKKHKTLNNFIVEIEANNIPSALMTTTADWWVLYDGENMFWTTPKKIHACISENKLKSRYFSQDSGGKTAYFIPKELLFNSL